MHLGATHMRQSSPVLHELVLSDRRKRRMATVQIHCLVLSDDAHCQVAVH